MVDTYGSGCAIDSSGSTNCQIYVGVKRQLVYKPISTPRPSSGPNARYFTEWFMTLEPEQDRYAAYLTVNYADPQKPEDAYVFLPHTAPRAGSEFGEPEDWTPNTHLQAR